MRYKSIECTHCNKQTYAGPEELCEFCGIPGDVEFDYFGELYFHADEAFSCELAGCCGNPE